MRLQSSERRRQHFHVSWPLRFRTLEFQYLPRLRERSRYDRAAILHMVATIFEWLLASNSLMLSSRKRGNAPMDAVSAGASRTVHQRAAINASASRTEAEARGQDAGRLTIIIATSPELCRTVRFFASSATRGRARLAYIDAEKLQPRADYSMGNRPTFGRQVVVCFLCRQALLYAQ